MSSPPQESSTLEGARSWVAVLDYEEPTHSEALASSSPPRVPAETESRRASVIKRSRADGGECF